MLVGDGRRPPVDGADADVGALLRLPASRPTSRAAATRKELEELRRFKREAQAEIERLHADLAALNSWLEDASNWMKVEHVQQQRVRMMRAADRDRRVSLVRSLPLVLALVYALGIAAIVGALLLGRL